MLRSGSAGDDAGEGLAAEVGEAPGVSVGAGVAHPTSRAQSKARTNVFIVE
jgi:hypothetical protein